MLNPCFATELFSLLLRLPLWIHPWRRPPSPGFPVRYQEHVVSWYTTNTPQRSSSLIQQCHIDTKRAPPSKRCATGCWCHISLSAAAVADVHVSLFHFAIVQLQDGNPLHLESKISPSIIVFCTVRSIIVCANLQFTMVCEDNIYANLPTKAARYSLFLPKEALPVLPLLWNDWFLCRFLHGLQLEYTLRSDRRITWTGAAWTSARKQAVAEIWVRWFGCVASSMESLASRSGFVSNKSLHSVKKNM